MPRIATPSVTDTDTDVLPRFWDIRKVDASELPIDDAIDLFLTDRTKCHSKTKGAYRYACERFAHYMKKYGLNYLSGIDGNLFASYLESLQTPFDKARRVSGATNKRAWMNEHYWAKKYTSSYISDLCRPVGTMISYFQRKEKLPMFFFDLPDEDDDSPLDYFEILEHHLLSIRQVNVS
jgi:hypothetical protein